MRNTTSERRPRILVVGSFVMDQIAVTSKFPKEGQSVIGRSFQRPPAAKARIRRFRRQGSVPM